MSILIKGVEMPSKCIECRLMRRCGKDDLDYVCMPASVYVEDLTNAYKPRPEYCPLVPVPPHGRLGDLDALYEVVKKRSRNWAGGWSDIECVLTGNDIKNAPTIIPADGNTEMKYGNIDTDFWGEEYAEAKGLDEDYE